MDTATAAMGARDTAVAAVEPPASSRDPTAPVTIASARREASAAREKDMGAMAKVKWIVLTRIQ